MKIDSHDQDRLFFDEMRRSHAAVEQQVSQTRLTIERSQELLRTWDEVIAKSILLAQPRQDASQEPQRREEQPAGDPP
jgi:hypothetical protein